MEEYDIHSVGLLSNGRHEGDDYINVVYIIGFSDNMIRKWMLMSCPTKTDIGGMCSLMIVYFNSDLFINLKS